MKSGLEKIRLDDFQAAHGSSSESKSLLAQESEFLKHESSDDVEMIDENPKVIKSRFAVTPVTNIVTTTSEHLNQLPELTNDDYSDLLLRYVRENRLNKVKELFELKRDASRILSDDNLNYNSISSNRSNYLNQVQVSFDINVLDEYKQTPLHIATRLNLNEIAIMLIDEGAKVNETDADNWTPLMNCAKNGNIEVARLLIEKKALIDPRDSANFTPLMWACYKNKIECVKLLLKNNANPNAQCRNSISCLSWACGRGYVEIVNELLKSKNIKVNLQDQNSSTPLLWAARKGNLDIVKALIEKEADPNIAGMYAITPLIASIKFGHSDIALFLANLPNVNLNHIDKDGNTALQISAKSGQENVVLHLLEKGAYINMPNLKGDSILITAVKGGHKQIIDELLLRHVAIDQSGNQGKTAMYHAVEKGNFEIVKTLLMYKPDLEIETHEGDTLLLLAVKKKLTKIVSELLNNGARVSPVDKHGDNVLHISLRNRSREITELILSNPKNSKYLYKPNKSGDTPYKIDASNPKSILTQIFGARQLNMTEDNILGYDLYSSALAEILSEPSLRTPITVGIYAKWGSGKSFLLSQLKTEMKSFAKLTRVVTLKITFSTILTIIILNFLWTFPFGLWQWTFGLTLFIFFIFLMFSTIGVCKFFHDKKQMEWAARSCEQLSRQIDRFKLFLRILFLNPNKYKHKDDYEHKNLRFIFTEYGKISTLGGENALAYMIATLNTKIETELGTFITRLCRVFYHKNHSHSKFRRICCVPSFVVVILISLLLISLAIFLRVKGLDFKSFKTQELAFILTIVFIVLVSIFGSFLTWSKMCLSFISSPSTHILNVVHSKDKNQPSHESKVESIIFKLKKEVDYISHTVKTIDSFTHGRTRLVIVIDGLDSCEQSKVIQILEIVHVLFTREDDPFICILAVDPHVLIKGIEGNLNAVLRNGNVNGHDYLRTVIHLPVYLQVDLAKARAVSKLETFKSVNYNLGHSQEIVSKEIETVDGNKKKKKRKSLSKPINPYGLTDQLIKSDYFSDVNPRNLRRLINIIALTGRLLRAYHIEFNWRILASWIYLNENWPYRSSVLVYFYEEHQNQFTEETSLNEIYKFVKNQIPSSNEPLLELDRNPVKFEQFLENCSPNLTAVILKRILPCTCNLDPYLIKLIRESIEANHEKHVNIPSLNSVSSFPIFTANNMPNLISQSSLNQPSSNHTFYGQTLKQYGLNTNSFIEEIQIDLNKPFLEQMTVEDISQTINCSIDQIDEKNKLNYIKNAKEKNINGKVLLFCDLDELKTELQMSFGDWQLFKNWVLAQRVHSIQNSKATLKQPLASSLNNNNIINKAIEKNESNNKVDFYLKEIEENESSKLDNLGLVKNSSAIPLLAHSISETSNSSILMNTKKTSNKQVIDHHESDEEDDQSEDTEKSENEKDSKSAQDSNPVKKEGNKIKSNLKSLINRQRSKEEKKTSFENTSKQSGKNNDTNKNTYYIFEDDEVL